MRKAIPECVGCKGRKDDLYQDCKGDWYCGFCLMREHDQNVNDRCPNDGAPLVFTKNEGKGGLTRTAVCLQCRTAFIGLPKRAPQQMELLPPKAWS